MTIPSRTFLFFFCLLAPVCMEAQDAVSEFASRVASSMTSCSYRMTMAKAGSVGIATEGTMLLQDASYRLEGGGLQIWCDGKSLWTVDKAAGEVVIENAGCQDHPALILSNLKNDFTWKTQAQSSSFATSPAGLYRLTPVRPGDLTGMDLFFDRQGQTLLGAVISLKDMTSITLFFSSFRFSPKDDSLPFCPPPFDYGWVVTDLR